MNFKNRLSKTIKQIRSQIKTQTIILTSICAILLISGFYIGSPIKYNALIVNLISSIIGIIYIVSNIKQRKQIITNKIDILVIIICLAPIIPMIFNTYTSLQDNIYSLFRYQSLLIVYFLAKEIGKEKRNREAVIDIIILIGIILCVLGIDQLTFNIIFPKIQNIFNLVTIKQTGEMFSTLGYKNTFSILIGVVLLLSAYKYNQQQNIKIKGLWSSTIFLFLICVFLAKSKISLVIIFGALITFGICIKDRERRLQFVYLMFCELILTLLYIKCWTSFISIQNNMVLCILFLIFIVISYILSIVIKKTYKYIINIPIKKIAIGFIIIILIIIIFISYMILTNRKEDLILFSSNQNISENKFKIYDIQKNNKYKFEFDIESISKTKNIDIFEIEVLEENKYYDTIKSQKIKFNNEKGIKEIEFETSQDAYVINIFFRSKNKIAQEELRIKSLYINGKEYILKYKMIPLEISKSIKELKIWDKGVWERIEFIKDGIKLTSQHSLLGLGGNAWEYYYMDIQSHVYEKSQVHSYIVQLWIEYGIIPVIAFLFLIVKIIVIERKKEKRLDIAIFKISIMMLVIHSCVDFDMSFLITMVLLFSFIGLISSYQKEIIPKKEKIFQIILLIIFIMSGTLETLSIMKKNNWIDEKNVFFESEYKKKEIINNIYSNEIDVAISKIEELTKIERKIDIVKLYHIMKFENLSENEMEIVYKNIDQIPIKINPYYNQYKNDLIIKIIEENKNSNNSKLLAQIIIKQNEEVLKVIENTEKNRLTKEKKEKLISYQNQMYDISKKYVAIN